ncbi:MAG: cytochrome C assembly family protein [Pseudomonadota bacterium]
MTAYSALTVLLAGALYLLATVQIARAVRAGRAEQRAFFLYAGFAAAMLHGTLVARTLFAPGGIDLGLFSAGSLVGLLIALLAILTSLFRPVGVLTVAAYPVAFLLMLLSELMHDQYTPRHFTTGVGVHIVLSLLAYAVLAIATASAVLLGIQSRRFREHRVQGLLRALPPIQTMEAILFELIAVGFGLLTLAILVGFLYVENFFAQHLIHKTVLTLAGWLALAGLLAGHRVAGWRGRTAIRWTVSSFVLLVVAFFGSKFVLEMVLHR